jgi:hypothetical protein
MKTHKLSTLKEAFAILMDDGAQDHIRFTVTHDRANWKGARQYEITQASRFAFYARLIVGQECVTAGGGTYLKPLVASIDSESSKIRAAARGTYANAGHQSIKVDTLLTKVSQLPRLQWVKPMMERVPVDTFDATWLVSIAYIDKSDSLFPASVMDRLLANS